MNKIKELKELINNIRNNQKDGIFELMLYYVNCDIQPNDLTTIHDAVILNIDGYEYSVAYTFYLMGYNYLNNRILSTEDVWVLNIIEEDKDKYGYQTEDKQLEIFDDWYLTITKKIKDLN